MNKIHFTQRHELKRGDKTVFVMNFSTSDLEHVDRLKSAQDRTEYESSKLDDVRDRVTKALLDKGFVVESVNFSSMSITAIQVILDQKGRVL